MKLPGATFLLLGALVGLTSIFLRAETAPLRAGEFSWNPEFSTSGPRGTTVIVMGEKAPEPILAAQPGMIWWPKEAGPPRPIEGTYEWTPERSPEGPITILASAADKTVYVYRNGVPIRNARSAAMSSPCFPG